MHVIVLVAHKKGDNVDNIMYPYLFDSEEYYAVDEEFTLEEAVEYIKNCGSYNDEVTPLENIRDFFSFGTYQIDGNYVRSFANPNGYFDYCGVGGRFNNGLIDLNGNERSCVPVDALNVLALSFQKVYAFIDAYSQPISMLEEQSDVMEKYLKVKEWEEIYAEKIYFTIVDAHI